MKTTVGLRRPAAGGLLHAKKLELKFELNCICLCQRLNKENKTFVLTGSGCPHSIFIGAFIFSSPLICDDQSTEVITRILVL